MKAESSITAAWPEGTSTGHVCSTDKGLSPLVHLLAGPAHLPTGVVTPALALPSAMLQKALLLKALLKVLPAQ